MFQHSIAYIGILGLLSSSIEAMLGIPQLYLNFQRKNTNGLAPLLIFMWLFGDLFKLSYYYGHGIPMQLLACSGVQVVVDVIILGQFPLYMANRE